MKKLIITLIIGSLISIIALYYSFQNVPYNEFVDYLITINYFWIIPTLIISIINVIIRVIRWQVILKSVETVPFKTAYHLTMIGFMMNFVLPGRVGEVAKPYLLKKQQNITFMSGLASVAAERIFDMLTLIFLLIYALNNLTIPSDISISFGDIILSKATLDNIVEKTIIFSLIIIILVIVLLLKKTRIIIINIINKIPYLIFFAQKKTQNQISLKICKPLTEMIENTASVFSIIKSPYKIFQCVAYSILLWLTSVLTYYVMSFGCPGIELSFFETIAFLVIICIFISLPSVPGFWGLWEAGGVFALAIFGIIQKQALGFVLLTHVLIIVPMIILGYISAIMTGTEIMKYASFQQNNT